MITSATSFTVPENEFVNFDPDVDVLTLKETKKKPLPHHSYTPLHGAILEGSLEKVKRLIEEGENPYDQDINQDTILHYAAESGKVDLLKYLIEDAMCLPAAAKGWHGSTVLHSAAAAGQLETVKYLVNDCQLDPSTLVDNDSCSPLVYACRSGDIEMSRFLIEHMKETMSISDIFDVVLLKDETKNVHHNNILDVNAFRSDPLTSACYSGNLSLVKYLVEECNCDPFLSRGKYNQA